jgi:hypothetical protein
MVGTGIYFSAEGQNIRWRECPVPCGCSPSKDETCGWSRALLIESDLNLRPSKFHRGAPRTPGRYAPRTPARRTGSGLGRRARIAGRHRAATLREVAGYRSRGARRRWRISHAPWLRMSSWTMPLRVMTIAPAPCEAAQISPSKGSPAILSGGTV